MTERYVDYQGSRSHVPEAFAKDIQRAHKFAWPLSRCILLARAVWNIEDDLKFTWAAMRMMTETPKGYCESCGVGWGGFLACMSDRCRYVDDGFGNPSPEWPPMVPPLDRTPSNGAKSSQSAPPAAGLPLDGWLTTP